MRAYLLPLTLGLVGAVACATTSETTVASDAGKDVVDLLPPSMGSGAAGTGLATGLPCDVQALLENRCIACHDGRTQFAMLTYADLVAGSPTNPAESVAQRTLARMQDPTNSMPPKPAAAPDPDEIAVMDTWVKAGTPRNPDSCTDPPPSPQSADPASATVVCTSGTTWTMGDTKSELMHPGRACNACHQIEGGPNLGIAGTVFPTSHEPDDCNGAKPPPQIVVTVTDARQRRYDFAVNDAGNFGTTQRARAPFRAMVTVNGKTRAMKGSVTSGDCNSCHTVQGANSAPGRIQTP